MIVRVIGSALLLFLAGCSVGPSYCCRPRVPLPKEYCEAKKSETVEISDCDLVHWWSRFQDPCLDALIQRAVCQNFDFRIAAEKVCQARAQYCQQFAQIFPEFDFSALGTRSRTSKTLTAGQLGFPLTQNFYTLGFDAIWEIDIFGKLRHQADSAYDLWQASEADRRGAKILLIAEVVRTYVTIRGYQKERQIAEERVIVDQELVLLAHDRFAAGLADEQEEELAQASFEQDRAACLAWQELERVSIYSMALLLGQLPECVGCYFVQEREIPSTAGIVPRSLASCLLRRRPDIVASERRLASATNLVGAAVADLFPTVALTGTSSSYAANPLQGANYGLASNSLNQLFKPISNIWGVGGFMTLPLLDFGRRSAAIAAQESLCRQAYLAYQKSVLAALQETEQALASYFEEEKRYRAFELQAGCEHRVLQLTEEKFRAGLANYTEVLQTKGAYLAALEDLTNSKEAAAVDLIAIYKALGGQW